MDAELPSTRPALATGVAVAVIVLLHAAVCAVIISAVDPVVDDMIAYWLVSVHLPELAWAVLVVGRAIMWRRRSAFWLGASAGIVVVGCFLAAFMIVIARIDLKGVPLALVFSSWVLLVIAVAVALLLRALGHPADLPIDAEAEPAEPAPAEPVDEPEAAGEDAVAEDAMLADDDTLDDEARSRRRR